VNDVPLWVMLTQTGFVAELARDIELVLLL
jgi:hypothetical protein